jgi:tetratricopeptide (TPR) repeat protein
MGIASEPGDTDSNSVPGKKNPHKIEYVLISDPSIYSYPKEKIWLKNKFLHTTGEQKVARINNLAIQLLEKNDYRKSRTLLEKGRKIAPQFLPFRYNLGITYFSLRLFNESLLEFQYAARLIQKWSKIYNRIGDCYIRLAKYSLAEDEYKKALKIDPMDLEALISLGNHFFEQKIYHQAQQYYNYALKIDAVYPDALFGIGKVLFAKNLFYDAVLIFQSINLKGYEDYDKGFHFYFAESLYKLKRYTEATAQYKKLLTYPGSPFFLNHAVEFVRFKLDLAERFSEVEQREKRFR